MADEGGKESWEDQLSLADLSLDKSKQQEDNKDSKGDQKASPAASPPTADAAHASGTAGDADPPHEEAFPDSALLSALLDLNKERALVLHMEQEVLNFLSDSSRDIFEFPVEYSNYQRMLAHKVAQYYNLQTTTADHEGNQCRVVAHRTGVRDKNKALLSSLDVTAGSPLALAARSSGPWQETPKLLKRPTRHDHPANPAGAPTTVTPKDRDEAYDRARARILTDGESSFPAAGFVGGGRGRGAVFAGRGRRGGGRAGAELHDPDYTRGMARYGMGAFEGPMHGMAPPMMMMPQGATPMYAMHGQQPEMAWGGAVGMYGLGRQPPPPPPGSSGGNSYTSKGTGAVWSGGGGGVILQAGSAVTQPSTPAATSTTAVPPPPPPPPHGSARPYSVPGGGMLTATPFQQGAAGPMAMYPAGSMQPMPGMGNAMYAYPLPAGGYGYTMVSPEQAMAMSHGSSAHMGAYPAGTYPGAMQAMGAQRYQGMYGQPVHGAAMTGMSPGMAVPRSPGSPGMAMAYAPMHGMHGYAMPYPMQAMQAHPGGMSTLSSAGSGGLYPAAGMQGPGSHMGGTYHMNAANGGRGGGRGGYKHYQHSSAHHQQSSAASGPNSTSSLASKQS